MQADFYLAHLIRQILLEGSWINTRNAETVSHFSLPPVTFTKTPLVTLRKTAWKKALLEMQWFLSGDNECPEQLLGWWQKQLSPGGYYIFGYPDQYCWFGEGYDQIEFLLKEIKEHPHSRRLLLTAWNPEEMDRITETNENPNTPTTCHSTMIQFFVRDGKLHAKHYQRSADMLLGVPHNWIQHWALLLFLAHHTGNKVGTLQWIFGDAHIYNEVSHMEIAGRFFTEPVEHHQLEMIYTPSKADQIFRVADFAIFGEIPEPKILTKPKLFE